MDAMTLDRMKKDVARLADALGDNRCPGGSPLKFIDVYPGQEPPPVEPEVCELCGERHWADPDGICFVEVTYEPTERIG
jgi:hypothetical protein